MVDNFFSLNITIYTLDLCISNYTREICTFRYFCSNNICAINVKLEADIFLYILNIIVSYFFFNITLFSITSSFFQYLSNIICIYILNISVINFL